jgi:hypothetical protein
LKKINLIQENRPNQGNERRFGALIYTSKIISSFYLNLLEPTRGDSGTDEYFWKFYSGKPFELKKVSGGVSSIIQNHII